MYVDPRNLCPLSKSSALSRYRNTRFSRFIAKMRFRSDVLDNALKESAQKEFLKPSRGGREGCNHTAAAVAG